MNTTTASHLGTTLPPPGIRVLFRGAAKSPPAHVVLLGRDQTKGHMTAIVKQTWPVQVKHGSASATTRELLWPCSGRATRDRVLRRHNNNNKKQCRGKKTYECKEFHRQNNYKSWLTATVSSKKTTTSKLYASNNRDKKQPLREIHTDIALCILMLSNCFLTLIQPPYEDHLHKVLI